jgi:DNA-binding transcriptional regulator YdaS (Cro superfamily)
MEKTGIARAIERAGSQAAMAAELGVTQQSVSEWVKAGYVPAGRAVAIESLYGVPRIDLVAPKLRSIAAGAPQAGEL